MVLKFYINIKKLIVYVLYFIFRFSKDSFFKNRIVENYDYFKMTSISYIKERDKIFLSANLEKNSKYAYYNLNPMPSLNSLNNYYENYYWKRRDDRERILNKRDFDHFEIIDKKLNLLNNKNINVLNFGSGHGGISILLRAKGCKVYNIDFGSNKTFFDDVYYSFSNFDKLPKNISFDLIYSSHALEHVLDIHKTLENFKKYSNNSTKFFFEVPNGCDQKKIEAAHTYYFTLDFFEEIFDLKNKDNTFYDCHIYNFNEGKVFSRKSIKGGGPIRVFTNKKLKI